MTYYWANGDVVARSYKHFFDIGKRFETVDPITGLHNFCADEQYNIEDDIPRLLAGHIRKLVEKYEVITVTVEEYK